MNFQKTETAKLRCSEIRLKVLIDLGL